MIITKIEMQIIPNLPRIKAVASIFIEGNYVLNDIKLVLCNNGKIQAEFPRNKNRCTFAPLNPEARSYVETKLLREYFNKIHDPVKNKKET